jgi:glycosyltransferase involved in cell wall biosynthesis
LDVKDRRVAIVMTYYNREHQFRKTLETIKGSVHENFTVFVVDDASPEPLHEKLRDSRISHIRIEPEEKKWVDVVPFNIGIGHALLCEPDVLIIQNAECYHVGDVISFAAEHVDDDNWISYACWTLSEKATFEEHDIHKIIKRCDPMKDGIIWYNHPVWNPRRFHFCTALSPQTMVELNGFDERFMYGRGKDDNDFVRRISMLGKKCIATDEKEPFVVHQWHPPSAGPHDNQQVWGEVRSGPARATHLVTEDFPWKNGKWS